METQPLPSLTPEGSNVPDMSQCTLTMGLHGDKLDVCIQAPPDSDDVGAAMPQATRRSIPLGLAKGLVAALEDVVYDNTLLLSDFASTKILIDTRRFIIVPAEMTDETLRYQMMALLWPADDYEVMSDAVTDSDALLWAADSDLLGFIRRTFMGISICHSLSPMARRCHGLSANDNMSRMYVRLHPAATDIMFMRDGKLAVLNTYDTPQVSDALYYIMAVVQAAEFSAEYDEMALAGDTARRDELLPELSKYIRSVNIQDF